MHKVVDLAQDGHVARVGVGQELRVRGHLHPGEEFVDRIVRLERGTRSREIHSNVHVCMAACLVSNHRDDIYICRLFHCLQNKKMHRSKYYNAFQNPF